MLSAVQSRQRFSGQPRGPCAEHILCNYRQDLSLLDPNSTHFPGPGNLWEAIRADEPSVAVGSFNDRRWRIDMTVSFPHQGRYPQGWNNTNDTTKTDHNSRDSSHADQKKKKKKRAFPPVSPQTRRPKAKTQRTSLATKVDLSSLVGKREPLISFS